MQDTLSSPQSSDAFPLLLLGTTHTYTRKHVHFHLHLNLRKNYTHVQQDAMVSRRSRRPPPALLLLLLCAPLLLLGVCRCAPAGGSKRTPLPRARLLQEGSVVP